MAGTRTRKRPALRQISQKGWLDGRWLRERDKERGGKIRARSTGHVRRGFVFPLDANK